MTSETRGNFLLQLIEQPKEGPSHAPVWHDRPRPERAEAAFGGDWHRGCDEVRQQASAFVEAAATFGARRGMDVLYQGQEAANANAFGVQVSPLLREQQ
jgi:hypothetical protein